MDFEGLAADDRALDFRCAFADGAELDIALELLEWVVFDETVPAVELVDCRRVNITMQADV